MLLKFKVINVNDKVTALQNLTSLRDVYAYVKDRRPACLPLKDNRRALMEFEKRLLKLDVSSMSVEEFV